MKLEIALDIIGRGDFDINNPGKKVYLADGKKPESPTFETRKVTLESEKFSLLDFLTVATMNIPPLSASDLIRITNKFEKAKQILMSDNSEKSKELAKMLGFYETALAIVIKNQSPVSRTLAPLPSRQFS
jgi:hypothetical protein